MCARQRAAYGRKFDQNKRNKFLRFQLLRTFALQFEVRNLPSGDARPISHCGQCQTAETLEAAFNILALVALKTIEGEPHL